MAFVPFGVVGVGVDALGVRFGSLWVVLREGQKPRCRFSTFWYLDDRRKCCAEHFAGLGGPLLGTLISTLYRYLCKWARLDFSALRRETMKLNPKSCANPLKATETPSLTSDPRPLTTFSRVL